MRVSYTRTGWIWHAWSPKIFAQHCCRFVCKMWGDTPLCFKIHDMGETWSGKICWCICVKQAPERPHPMHYDGGYWLMVKCAAALGILITFSLIIAMDYGVIYFSITGHILLTIYEPMIHILQRYVLLMYEKWSSYKIPILHIPRQLSCRVMCKIGNLLDRCDIKIRAKMIFKKYRLRARELFVKWTPGHTPRMMMADIIR